MFELNWKVENRMELKTDEILHAHVTLAYELISTTGYNLLIENENKCLIITYVLY